MKAALLHDTDFYAWTREQAAQLRRSRPNSVDWKHLAEEVEDLAKAELRTVLSQLRNVLAHLLKAAYSTDEGLIRHWRAEMIGFHSEALDAYTNAMQPQIERELGTVWRRACKQAAAHFEQPVPTFPMEYPFGLDEVLDEDFDIEQAVQRIRSMGQ
jgi:hypothetical protein